MLTILIAILAALGIIAETGQFGTQYVPSRLFAVAQAYGQQVQVAVQPLIQSKASTTTETTTKVKDKAAAKPAKGKAKAKSKPKSKKGKNRGTRGTGPIRAGAGHKWRPAVATLFGGKGDYQPTSFGGNTKDMDKAGVFYFAILPRSYGKLRANRNTPDAIVKAVRSGRLKPGGKLVFKNGKRTAVGVWLDVGPGATGDGRWLDFGRSLGRYLGVPGLGKCQWDFCKPGDQIVKPRKRK